VKHRPARRIVTLPGDWPGTIPKGRLRIFLGRSPREIPGWRAVTIRSRRDGTRTAWVHPAANSGGWTWLPRFIFWRETGEILREDEHVHHDCDHKDALRCVDPTHYRVVLAEFHGRFHATHTLLRDGRGRFMEAPDPPGVSRGSLRAHHRAGRRPLS
jgi:hypothetical protein